MSKRSKEMDILLRPALFLFIFWMILSFPADLKSENFWINMAEHFVIGAALSVFLAKVTKGMFLVTEETSLFNFKYVYRLFLYWLRLSADIILAGIDVARRIMRRKLLISPGIVEIDTSLKDDWLITLNGNSITLTPGTITVDVKKTKDGSRFLVHCISQDAVKDMQEGKGFVERIQKIYK
ncbi:MAG: Na+/H+ antiporter subunit E [bacterium]